MHSDSHLTWWEQLGMWLTILFVTIKNIWIGWMEHGGGTANLLYELMDAFVTVGFSAFVGSIIAFYVKKFLRKIDGNKSNKD